MNRLAVRHDVGMNDSFKGAWITVVGVVIGVGAVAWMIYRSVECDGRGGQLVQGVGGYVCVGARR